MFVKHHLSTSRVFEQLSSIYSRLNALDLEIHIPRPVICDIENNVSYLEYIEGTALSYITFRELILHRNTHINKLLNKIGQWLKHFHDATRLEKSMNLIQVKKNIYTGLESSIHFNQEEKYIIKERVSEINPENPFLMMVKPHNDFALRNIIYTQKNSFYVIDWDAMFHDKFRAESPIWNDITSFVINVCSLKRFSPLISGRTLTALIDSFLEGYFSEVDNPPDSMEIKSMLYLYTLKYYLGTFTDRPLVEIYQGNLGFRYIKQLHFDLLSGKSI